jgi:hypothetical protein
MPGWLRISILSVVSSICLLSFTEYAACTFYANPLLTKMYVDSGGKLPGPERSNCVDIDEQTIQALTGVLTTLLALATQVGGASE